MKQLILLFLGVFMIGQINAQIVNLNPDPNGDPWIAGGVKQFSSSEIAEMDAIPVLQLSVESANRTLPEAVDNSTLQYWPGIKLQEGASCAQFAGIYYTFTYEINRLRGLPSNSAERRYHYKYTYNFLNGGINTGTNTINGWDIVMENGCPTYEAFGGDYVSLRAWMSGYDKYYQSQQNKIKSYNQIMINDEDDIELLKHWINDHNEGSSTGGLSVFYCETSGMVIEDLPPQSQNAGEGVVVEFGGGCDHAMTMVGYNDNIMYDFNNDGQFTNNVDINNDGNIDLQDWEIGAVKVANSWGDWVNEGYVYVPYCLLASQHPYGIYHGRVFMMEASAEYSPDITYKIKVDHSSRCDLQYRVGYGINSFAENPTETANFSSFNNQGGSYPMQGTNNDPLESSLDYSYIYTDLILIQFKFLT